MSFELEKKYKRGKKTLMYLHLLYGWWLALFGISLIIAAWAITFGSARETLQQFLNAHPDWFVTSGMLAEWFFLFGLAFIFFAYLRANVMYRYYKFILDEHAFHLHRGWFSIQETTIPYRQISNVHITRPYHYRMFGIVKLDVVTSSNRDIDDTRVAKRKHLIPIIDTVIARDLSHFLLKKASKYNYDPRDENDSDDEAEDEAGNSDDPDQNDKTSE
jgi:uncharacterized membrane protein YdbT with pleckstrin-like domain